MNNPESHIIGLTEEQVLESREKFGANRLSYRKDNPFIDACKSIAKEPMVILLLATAMIYFISGRIGDGIFMTAAIAIVSAISLYQNSRSRNALEKLKDLSQPKSKVIRNGMTQMISSEDLVLGDSMIVEEGTYIAADASIEHSNDFSVNESILTGESLSVYKDKLKEDHFIYMGTSVSGGLAIATVAAIGNNTRLGLIGKSLENIHEEKTPLEIQIAGFVKKMVILGACVFMLVWGINYFRSNLLLDSLLKALTLAMSILPEEIPVAFTTFMAIGAWRLMKMGVVVKQMKTVETLGSATIICIDKTGTITENKMSLARLYDFATDRITKLDGKISETEFEIIRLSMFASEPIPFDAMEVVLHDFYTMQLEVDERLVYKLIHEYPLEGKPPMMTHLFENSNGERIIAAKGAPEALMSLCGLSREEKNRIEAAIHSLAKDGYRILGVGESSFSGYDYPKQQQEFNFSFKGLIAFYDPPKKNISSVLNGFYRAGMAVKLITGDNLITTRAIARQIGFKNDDKCMSGEELMQISDEELPEKIRDIYIFTRMFPEAKLRIINALKSLNEIVAMTGDGVNDGPALKAAHIGIAMGQRGTEIAKQASSLVLLEDDLSKMLDAVAMGRKIYSNLKKAIQYIISIHIPIILTVFLPLFLGWDYPNILSPLHVIFLELIMGPTCSIIYENEPMEKDVMLRNPRPSADTFFSWKELTTSMVQGLMISMGALVIYQYAVSKGYDEASTRSMVFTVLVSANIFLTLVNRSFFYSVFTTIRYKNYLVPLMIGLTIVLTGMLLFVRPLAEFFSFGPLKYPQLLLSIGTGLVSVIWYEFVKWRERIGAKQF